MTRLRWAGQLLLAALLVWFVGRALAGQWESLQRADLTVAPHAGWLALAVLAAAGTFLLQAESWRQALIGWNQRVPRMEIARIWFLANLGRYLPGKLWSLAGMIVLAGRHGVPAWAAATSAVVLQAVGLGTALALVAAILPDAETGLRLGLAIAVAGGTILGVASPAVMGTVRKLSPRLSEVRAMPVRALARCVVLTTLGWLAYGLSFWALARGVGIPSGFSLALATGTFALGYTVGVLAVFAPGGAVVREAVLLALLAPAIGAGAALVLTLASRIVLTLTELGLAAPFVISHLRSAPRASG